MSKNTHCLPNFIVVGAPKCGTTSLHLYLSEHPEIFMPEQKELHFFLKDGATWGTWDRGLDWYSSLFLAGKDCHARGEASPGYVTEGQTEAAARKISEVLPGAKLIYMIREPVSRMKSHFLEAYFNGYLAEGLSLNDIVSNQGIDDRPNSFYYADYVYTSMYSKQLNFLLKHHDLKNIFIATQEQFQAQPEKLLSGIFEFLDVDSSFVPASLSTRLNVSSHKRKRIVNPLNFISDTQLYRKLSENIPGGFKDMYRKIISKEVDIRKLTELSGENKQHLHALFRVDILELESKTGMNLGDWIKVEGKLQ